jgi:hypothetical protein
MTVTFVAEGPSFRILDQTAEDTIAARRQAKAEEEEAAATTNENEAPKEIVGDKLAKVYYPSGCQGQATVQPDKRVVFKTTEEAEQAGYKKAKTCE